MNPQTALDEALKHHSAGRFVEAEAAYRLMLQQFPDHPGALHLLGVALSQQGHKALAVEHITRAIKLAPNVADFHANLGLALLEKGEPQASLLAVQRALQLNPQHAEAYNIMGNGLKAIGKIDDAVVAYQRCLQIRGDHPDAMHNLADAYLRAGRQLEADQWIVKAAGLNPQDVRTRIAQGHALMRQGKLQEALSLFQAIVKAHPEVAEGHHGVATSFAKMDRPEEAVPFYEKAIELDGLNPGPLNNLGYALVTLGRIDEGIEYYYRALAIRPDLADTYNNLGNAFLQKLDTKRGMEAYHKALYLQPGHTDAHWNRSLMMLLLGDYEGGFPEYEWRWLRFPEQKRTFTQPLWDGGDIGGKVILLHAEQGLGDTLQFVRLVKEVAGLGGTVMLEVQAEVFPMVRQMEGATKVFVRGQGLPPFDFHCPLLSLPHALTMAKGGGGDPAYPPGESPLESPLQSPMETPSTPPYLTADAGLVKRFGEKIVRGEKMTVGIVWAGAAIHRRNKERSLTLKHFEEVLATPRVRFVSLQKGEAGREIGGLPEKLRERVQDLSGELHDFADTAGVVGNLDLVITVDTSVAHLVGGMGRPVWTLLSLAPDWRWGLGREETHWYGSMRLFRQERWGEWGGVMGRVAGELVRRVGGNE